jgi:hypothetical protein
MLLESRLDSRWAYTSIAVEASDALVHSRVDYILLVAERMWTFDFNQRHVSTRLAASLAR